MPAFLIFVLLFWIGIIIQEPMTYGPDNARLPYPTEVSSLVWSIFIIGVLQVFVAMAYIAYQRRNNFGSTWTYLTSPNPEWGPSNPATKADWAVFKADKWKQREEIVTSQKQTWLQQKYWLLMGKYPWSCFTAVSTLILSPAVQSRYYYILVLNLKALNFKKNLNLIIYEASSSNHK